MNRLKKHSLKTKLSLAIALVSLLTVALVSFLSNVLISQQFKEYIAKQQEQETQEIVDSLSQQYGGEEGWKVEMLHAIGMSALRDGYIVKIYDVEQGVLWDAQICDMELCRQLMDEISMQMQAKSPNPKGQFMSRGVELTQDGQTIGTANIGYYGPYFLRQRDFDYLESLNIILIAIGLFSLMLAVSVGWLMAKRISRPIQKTVDVAKQMSEGDYLVRVEEKADTTELDELIMTINRLANSLNKQEDFRKQLTADVAHELRTPLTTVGTHLEAMVEGVWQPSAERLQSCHDEIMRISTIVRDLESLAKAESSHITLNKKQIDLREMIDRALTSFEIEIKRKELQVAVKGVSHTLYADPDRIGQVIHNLLSNAVKYTPEGGGIRLTLSETPEHVVFSVGDDGIGIPEEDMPFIFERFYRAEKSRNRKTGGSGIGLAVVQSIVTAHGGRIEVKSKPGQGSVFSAILPR